MIIRLLVNNIFSFGEEREFNMLPSPYFSRLNEHKYKFNDLSILKLASIYGANGAGKSNLFKALSLLQEIILEEEVPNSIFLKKFRFNEKSNKNPTLAIEFTNNHKAYYYGIEISDSKVITEKLYQSGLGKKEDILIFERKNNIIRFFEEFKNNEEGKVLIKVIEKNLLKPNKVALKFLAELDNELLNDIKNAYNWFFEKLRIIMPDSKPVGIVHKIDIDKNFRDYAEDILRSFHLGVVNLKTVKKTLIEFFGSDNNSNLDDIVKKLNESPRKMIAIRNKSGDDEIVIVEENDEIFVKQLKVEHSCNSEKHFEFTLDEESDGTKRLLDFIPAFKEIVEEDKVYIIDEMERSIHPTLLKGLVKKFSFDSQTSGQLIFSTHESNLLDQKIFRQDEIWFMEKKCNGMSDLYSLSDFKEHNTKDIRKGYLNGRYGSIPFLANLEDLSWH